MRFRPLISLSVLVIGVIAGCGGGGDSPPPVSSDPAPGPPAVVETGSLRGVVRKTETGEAISGARVSAGSAVAMTNADGTFSIAALAVGKNRVVRTTQAGYLTQLAVVDILQGTESSVAIVMIPRGSVTEITPSAGGVVTDQASSARVSVPPNALIDPVSQAPITSSVSATVTAISPARDPASMPGSFVSSSGSTIESFGAVSVTIEQEPGGPPVSLAPGASATLRIPVSTRADDIPATVPLLSLDESTGRWTEEGSATLSGSAEAPFFEASIPRFATWNVDIPIETVSVQGCVERAGVRVAGVQVVATAIGSSSRSSAYSNAAGDFTLAIRTNARALLEGAFANLSTNGIVIGPSPGNLTLPACLQLGDVASAPSIVEQPESIRAPIGVRVAFNVQAVGSSGMTYRWQRNGVDIPGATSASYARIVSADDDGAQFSCVVQNSFGVAQCTAAVLTVDSPTPAPIPRPANGNYSGYFYNSGLRSGGTVDSSLAFGIAEAFGPWNFTQDPVVQTALCGSGDVRFTITGSSALGMFISDDPDPGCDFDRGSEFLLTGTFDQDASRLLGGYSIRNMGGSTIAEGGGVFEVWAGGPPAETTCTGTLDVPASSVSIAAKVPAGFTGTIGGRVIYGALTIRHFDGSSGQLIDCVTELRGIGSRQSSSSEFELASIFSKKTGSNCATIGSITTITFAGTIEGSTIRAIEESSNYGTLLLNCAAP